MKRPVRRCGNCKHFPGNGECCGYNDWTDGDTRQVKSWDYGCSRFDQKWKSRYD